MATRKKRWSTAPVDPNLLAKGADRVKGGETIKAAAAALGLKATTLSRYLIKAKKAGKAPAPVRKAGRAKALATPANGSADKNPNVLTITGLRDFVAFEVKRLLPEVVAAEMSKRFGGGQ
jgi:hypothetical protein